ncbi:ankyrin [Hypoxylon sp. FL0543]|nr:ankyrin [Hypoxylon sp. FL0543]
MAKLDELPTELQQMIATCGVLKRWDLAALTRVNKTLHSTINRPLYELFGSGYAIDWAVLRDRIDTLQIFTELGLNVRWNLSWLLLHVCEDGGRIEVITWLLDNGAEIDGEIVDGSSADEYSALYLAMRQGHQDIAILLLERGANPYFTHSRLSMYRERLLALTALHLAVDYHLFQVAEFIVQEGILGVDQEDSEGYTPLRLCCSHRDIAEDAIKLLAGLGANVNAKVPGGQSLLMSVLERGCLSMAAALLLAGATAKPRNLGPITQYPLQILLKHSWKEYARTQIRAMVSQLVHAGADINGYVEGGRTPLGEAVFIGILPEVTSHLLALGANPNGKDSNGHTPLDIFMGASGLIGSPNSRTSGFGSEESALENAKLVLAYGARMDTPLAGGRTLLEWALYNDATLDIYRRIPSTNLLEGFLAAATFKNLRPGYLDELLEHAFEAQLFDKCKILAKHGATLSSDKAFSTAMDMIGSFSENDCPRHEYCDALNVIFDMGLPTEKIADLFTRILEQQDEAGLEVIRGRGLLPKLNPRPEWSALAAEWGQYAVARELLDTVQTLPTAS